MQITIDINQQSIDDINHVNSVFLELYHQILFMKNPIGHAENPYPISVKEVYMQSVHPVNPADTELPVVFFSLGESRKNDAIQKPVNYRGETTDISINTLLIGNEEKDLLEVATDMQTATRMLVKGNQKLGNRVSEEHAKLKSQRNGYKVFEPSTKQVRLGRTIPFKQRTGRGRSEVSRRLLLVSIIEVDYIYSML